MIINTKERDRVNEEPDAATKSAAGDKPLSPLANALSIAGVAIAALVLTAGVAVFGAGLVATADAVGWSMSPGETGIEAWQAIPSFAPSASVVVLGCGLLIAAICIRRALIE